MAKLPDLSAYSMDELTGIIDDANKRIGELKKVRIAELQSQAAALNAELALLGASVKGGKGAPDGDGRKRASPKVTHRGPAGETWTSRGAKPRWLRQLIETGHKEEDYRV